MSVFDTLMADGLTVLNETHGDSVVLVRGALESSAMTCRHGHVRQGLVDSEITVSQRGKFREFYLPAAGCVLAGITTKPQPGDRIRLGTELWEIGIFDGSSEHAIDRRGLEWVCQTRYISG